MAVAATVAMLATIGTVNEPVDALVDPSSGILDREPITAPGDLGEPPLTDLQYGDALESMTLMAAPEGNTQGSAQLSHPLVVPPGRAGVEPDLAITYDSEAGTSWVGQGWDLSLGEVTLDTRFGAPRFDALEETETYMLEGEQLAPTAVRNTFLGRETDKSNFTRRVEDEYERVIRWGDSPTNYYWQVTDKNGTDRFYGGDPTGFDSSAVLADGAGNIFRWGLTYVEDISANVMRVTYEKPAVVLAGGQATGSSLYPATVRYTGSVAAAPAVDDPPYEVRFIRRSDRNDVQVDASGGGLDVVSDLLDRVEVWYGSPNGGGPRTYDQLVRAYKLVYDLNGPFDKTLLTAVQQQGRDGQNIGTHTFDYWNEVRDDNGVYNGFSDPVIWTTGAPGEVPHAALPSAGTSVLGTSTTGGGDGGAYIGFNLATASKTGSFGGSFSVEGSQSDGLSEFFDLNGDGLPDKVFVGNAGVSYRLNTSNPSLPLDAAVTFADPVPLGSSNVTSLSKEVDAGFSLAFEVHFGVTAQIATGLNFSTGDRWFSDVNGDGLADFVKDGQVFFNTPDPSGTPQFVASADETPIPLEDFAPTLPPLSTNIPGLGDPIALQREMAPLIDTVRRWVAPYAGAVSIDGTPTLTPPAAYDGDGVDVTIQRGGSELWRRTLATSGASETHTLSTQVTAGQALYFRVSANDDGKGDQVTWDPTITYDAIAPALLDLNGLSEGTYSAAGDFTLAGLGEALTSLPFGGTLALTVDAVQTGYLGDDARVVFHQRDWSTGTITEHAVTFTGSQAADGAVAHEPPAAPIVQTLTATIQASLPRPQDHENDVPAAFDDVWLTIESDTAINPNAIQPDPSLTYTTFTPGQSGDLDPLAFPPIPLIVSTNLFPEASPGTGAATAPPVAWTPASGSNEIRASLFAGGATGRVVLSVKTPTGLVAATSFDVPAGGNVPEADRTLTFDAVDGQDHFVELTVHDLALGAQIVSSLVEVEDNGGYSEIDHTRRWTKPQSVFPTPHRGWGAAGYNSADSSAGPLDESAFEIDTSQQAPAPPTKDSVGQVSAHPSYPYTPLGNDVDGGPTTPAWRLDRPSLSATATTMSASRLGTDRLLTGSTSLPAGVRPAPSRFAIGGPFLSFLVSLGVGVSGGISPSFGLRDFIDVNGDGIADIVTDGGTVYTTPRGGVDARADRSSLSGTNATALDTQFAFGGGIGGSPVAFSFKSTGDGPTGQDTDTNAGATGDPGAPAAGGGGSAAETTRGFNLGIGLSAQSTWTNPVNNDVSDISADNPEIPSLDEPTVERQLADMNGDGLPDVVVVSDSVVKVNLNTGYGFSPPIVWGGGGLEGSQTVSGTLSPGGGFQYNSFEIAAGVSLSDAVTWSRYSWVDIDGDGVVDRLRKPGNETDPIVVSWGNARDTASEVVYGVHATGAEEGVDRLVPDGPQIAQSRSSGLAAGFDFTISIGPLCVIVGLCYLIINPGAHGSGDIGRTTVQMVDVNGDSYPDSVRSVDQGSMEVRLNRRGRTNLLETVHNPIGGSIHLDYTRSGNTVDHAASHWLLSETRVDDGRPGDGSNVQSSSFTYEGNVFDRLERTSLGHARVIERQHGDPAANGDLGPVLRTIERKYHNESIFHSGQLELERIHEGDMGRAFYERTAVWQLAPVKTWDNDAPGAPSPFPVTNQPDREDLLGLSLSPRLIRESEVWFDADGDTQTTTVGYTYDDLGNVIGIGDEAEDETPDDNTFTAVTYSPCRGVTTSWVSVPELVSVHQGLDTSGPLLKRRDGSKDLCLNAVPIELIEWVDDTTRAMTDLTFDPYGSYNSVTYPNNGPRPPGSPAGPNRYRVDYVYDADRFTDIASVTDSHGITATATYDPFSGRLASRTDPNGHQTSYRYDRANRLSEIVSPKEAGGPTPTVRYEYFASTPTRHAYAAAHHIHPDGGDDPITTAAFVDGLGRVTQRKRDAAVAIDPDGDAPLDVRIVEGAVDFDALGREVRVWYPITEAADGSQLGVYNPDNSSNSGTVAETDATETDYDALDRPTGVTLPDGSVAQTRYGVDSFGGIELFAPVAVDPLGKEYQTFRDVRGLVHAHVERPLDVAAAGDSYAASAGTTGLITTSYAYDALGRVTAISDPEGAVTASIYDMADNMTSIDTPDGGLIDREWSPAGSLLAETDPVRRANFEQTTWTYDRDRLVEIDYPGDDIDVLYEYDSAPAPAAEGMGINAPIVPGDSNQISQVARITDGSAQRVFQYDEDGNTRAEHTTMFTNPFDPVEPEATTYRTSWTYDSFGRVTSLTFHDGEVVDYGFDSGGMVDRIVGTLVPAAGPVPTGTTAGGQQVLSEYGSYEYIQSQQYDEFLRPVYRRTEGNTETIASYDDDRLWFDGQVSTAAGGRIIQDLDYTYDTVGNVLAEANSLPAPTPSKPEGPTANTWGYDPYYRVTRSTGSYEGPKDREDRGFLYEADYAPNGRLLDKSQTAVTGSRDVADLLSGAAPAAPGSGGGNGKKNDGNPSGGPTDDGNCDQPTNSGGGDTGNDTQITYSLDLEYSADHPHQLIRSGSRDYTWDANGNLTAWVEDCTDNSSIKVRVITWDAARRMASISDGDTGNSATTYRYSAEGTRSIERGPGGEYSFINDVWTVWNGGKGWKHIFLGDERIALRRRTSIAPTTTCLQPGDPVVDADGNPIPDPCEGMDTCLAVDGTVVSCAGEPTIYFLHTDLRGSTRMVTDEHGDVFEHVEYLPTGRPWVRNGSNNDRVPYRFGGGWADDTYQLVSFGARWYEPREEHLYGVDPILIDDPTAAIDSPTLLSAYSYAANNPATLVDPDGRAPTFVPRNRVYDPDVHERDTALQRNSKRLASITTMLKFNFENGSLTKFRVFGVPIPPQRTAADDTVGNPVGANQTEPVSVDDTTDEDDTSESIVIQQDDGIDMDRASLTRSSQSGELTEVQAEAGGDNVATGDGSPDPIESPSTSEDTSTGTVDLGDVEGTDLGGA